MASKLQTGIPFAQLHAHWCTGLPYKALVHVGESPHGTPLYQVAGSEAPAQKAVGALKAALKVHGGRCFYCPEDAACVTAHLEIDHVEPKARCRNDLLHNLVIACKDCNGAKGTLPVEAFSPNAGRAWLLAAQAMIRARLQLLEEDGA